MSSETTSRTGLTCCTFCSLGCRAGLRETAPDQYVPDYPEGAGADYAGLCARGSMLAELTNHRERLLWPLASINGDYAEVDMGDAVRRAGDVLQDGLRGGRVRAVIDGNFDLQCLAQTVAALEKVIPRQSIAFYLPQADADLLTGSESSGADYAAPEAIAEADAVLIVGNPFATHPVIAHWVIHPRLAKPRRPTMVLDVRGGVTQLYATSRCLVAAGREHVALALVARSLGVKVPDCDTAGLDVSLLESWGKALSEAKKPVVIVGAEFGRAARWVELGRLAGDVAKAARGTLVPLTVYGNALGAARLAGKLSLAAGDASAASTGDAAATVTLAFGTGMAERVCGEGRCVSASSLRPIGKPGAELVLPIAWPFEATGPVLLPGQGVVNSSPAIPAPAGVPTAGELAAAIAGSPGAASADFANLPRLQTGASKPLDLTPLSAGPSADGLLTVLAGDGVNFADGAISRRAAFARSALPHPMLSLSRADATRLALSDGEVVQLSAASGGAGPIRAQVVTEEAQAPGRATLSGAYPEAQRLMAGAGGDGRVPALLRVSTEKQP